MKRTSLITMALMLLTIAAVSGAAQTAPRPTGTATPKPAAPPPARPANAPIPETKIAIVNTDMFRDQKVGIRRYLNAVATMQREFEPRNAELVTLQNRLKALSDEITKLSGNPIVDPKSIQLKQDEGERLQRELKYKKEQLDADIDKRYGEVVGPVSTDIGNALGEYATQHGLTMVLDISKLLPAVLAFNPATDISEAFIADYNSKHP